MPVPQQYFFCGTGILPVPKFYRKDFCKRSSEKPGFLNCLEGSQKPGFFHDLIAAAKDFREKPGFLYFGASRTVKVICVDLR